jgi:hypothetical protein
MVVPILTLLNALLILVWVKHTGRWRGIRPELAEYRDCNEQKVGLVSTAPNLPVR